MKKIFILLLCFICLAGCARKTTDDPTPDPAGNGMTSINEPDTMDGGGPDAQRCEDEEGLISVYIWPNGHADIFFGLEQWDKLHGIYDNVYFDLDRIRDGPFAIVTAGKSGVKAACIGKIDDPDMGYLSLRDFITPTVVLLMEDGSLEFLRADPFEGAYRFDDSLYSCKIPWLKDVVSLSYEYSGEGMGGMTIYAEDKDGLLYNVQLIYNMFNIFGEKWYFRQQQNGAYDWRYCVLQFSEDNSEVLFESGLNDGVGIWDYGVYEGSYQITLAENDRAGWRPGLVTFDLSMTEGDSQRKRIVGTYNIRTPDGFFLNLYYSDGDHLAYGADGESLTEFAFYRFTDPGSGFWENEYDPADSKDGYDWHSDGVGTYDDEIVIIDGWDEADFAWILEDEKYGRYGTEGFTNEGIVNYLMAKLPEAREKVQKLGMAALCTGEVTVLNGVGICRDVWLGTNHPGQFVREIRYLITDTGDIYVYDAVKDEFYLEFSFWP